jgi:MYXO-CTERM domain-containing protein
MRFVLTLALALGVSSVTLAHDPPSIMQFVSMTPTDVLLTSNRGLIFGDPTTRKWSLLCNEAVGVHGVTSSEPYAVALVPSGRMLVATASGLSVSDDRGCSFRDVPGFADLTTRGLVQHPTDPQQLYVIGQGTVNNQIQHSTDGGDSWQPVLTVPSSEYPQSLLIAPGDPLRLYASIWQLGVDVDTHFVVRSSDGGKTWERSEVELTEDEREVILLAVNPVDANELLARATAVNPVDGERLLHSRDGGRTFTSNISIKSLKGATFSPDGLLAYAAGGSDGLYRATGPERTFSLVAGTARISAVRSSATELLAAGYYQGLEALRDGSLIDGIGRTTASGTSFDHWMAFREIQSQVSCPATSTAITKCARLWTDWQSEHPPLSDLAGADADAGWSDAGAPRSGSDAAARPSDAGAREIDAGARSDAGSGDSANDAEITEDTSPIGGKPRRKASGCTVSGESARSYGSWSLALALLVLAHRRRRHSR